MKANLLMDFSIDKENNKLTVKREFAAPVTNVWAAWTQPELLDLWWAPKPYKTETKSMDFREGGFWFYCMVGPEGEKHWCRADYQSITPLKNYKGLDAFCDKDGNITDIFPRTKWSVSFTEADNKTLVFIENSFEKLSDLETIIQMGFKEGFTAALENLDALIEEGKLK